jgi:septal ring factor EnvC (AmiA/AmiB activator)
MKRIQALVAALIITSLVGLGMAAIGVNALVNPNSVPVSNSPNSPSAAVVTTSSDQAQAQIAQLEARIAQYQAREQQYQAQLNQETQRLSQAESQVQQLQGILVELQNLGVIQIQRDGTIQLFTGRRRSGDGD